MYPSNIVSASAANYGQSGAPLDVTLPSSYKLSEVSGTTTPCPMIATNTPGAGWTFSQLCGLLRLTVNDIPAAAKRLEIEFNGQKVSGVFAIAAEVTPGTSKIETSVDADHDVITITKDGTNTTLGATSLVLNIPLPTGVYEKITVIAYDALTGGNALLGKTVAFAYTAQNAHATTKTAVLGTLQSTFNFTFKCGSTTLDDIRFVRVFSVKNKLHNETSYGPYTKSADTDFASPVSANLYFDKVSGDQLAFQVVTSDGKVYSGLYDAPLDGYGIGETYDVMANVKLYTFTVASGKVYFSPGDLGVDNGTYSFTEPFTTWGWDSSNVSLATRVWFDYREIQSGHVIYGINWRNFNSLTTSTITTQPQEWDKIIGRTNMNAGVQAYYRVNVSGHANCLLLPPDETQSTDIGADLTSGTVTDYAKYLGKGFVLLISTGRALYSSTLSWGYASQGWYWALWKNMSNNRTYFCWIDSGTPTVSWATNEFRMRVRYVRDVE